MCHRNFEACRSLNGGFTASKLERDLAERGHNRPIALSPVWTLKGPLDSETCRMAYGSTSATADIGSLARVGPQCVDYLSLGC